MKGMLKRANEGNYAVMAINCFNIETARAVIDAAASLRAPIIINIVQEHLVNHCDSALIAPIVKQLAQRASVEVALNFDHGADIALVKKALHDGFSSVMMDASCYDLDQNIAITRSIVEFAQIGALFVVVQSLYVLVEPHLASAQCRSAVALQRHAGHVDLRQDVADAAPALDNLLAEVLVEEGSLHLRVGLEDYLDDFGFAVGVGRKVEHAASGLALREVIFAVARDAGHVKALYIAGAGLSVAIDHIVDGAGVVLLEDGDVDQLGLLLLGFRSLGLAHEELVGDVYHLIRAVLVEEDNVVDVRTVAYELVLLQRGADEALLAVYVQLLVGFDHLGCRDGVEVLYLGQARMVLAVFLLDEAEPVAGHLHHVVQLAVDLLYLLLDAGDELVGLVLVELQDAGHLDFHQAQDVFLRYLAYHLGVPWGESFVDPQTGLVHRLGILELSVLVDALLDEDTLQRGEVQALHQLALADETLLPEQLQRGIDISLEHLAYGEETGLAVVDDAAVG